MPDIILMPLVAIYVLCTLGLAVYGLNSLFLVLVYLRRARRPIQAHQPGVVSNWPKVTIQLPIYNERYTVERLLEAVTRIDYPRDLLQIQVLDDSTDLTASIVHNLVTRYQAEGVPIEWIHRTDRAGFKAGALANGLDTATGEFVAIFDADFVPPPSWLRRVIPEFLDPEVGCVQTRWGHINHRYNALTRAQALGIDGHFIIEQAARSRGRLFLTFNGSAGAWRRMAIDDAGGWQTDTLTEDMDLSYRAQLRGWRIMYRPDIVVPAEIPAHVDAFETQQFRWAKGTIQTARKLVPEVLARPDLPAPVKFSATVHLCGYLIHVLMLVSMLLFLPVGLYAQNIRTYFPWSILSTLGPPLVYVLAHTAHMPRVRDRLTVLPLLLFLGFGLSLNNSVAAIQGLLSRGGEFKRTPKFNLNNSTKGTLGAAYPLPNSPIAWGELLLAIYSAATVALLWSRHNWGAVMWILGYTLGFLFLAGTRFIQYWQMSREHSRVAKSKDRSTVSV